VHLVTTGNLQPVFEVPIYGRITVMELFRPEVRAHAATAATLTSSSFLSLSHRRTVASRVVVVMFPTAQGYTKDMLFVCTARFKFAILSYDSEAGVVVTEANGDLKDAIGREADRGHIGIIDDKCRLVGMYMYEGAFKVRRMHVAYMCCCLWVVAVTGGGVVSVVCRAFVASGGGGTNV
jgi:DNA damage-binding protein 1